MFSVTFFRLSRSNLHSYDREKKTPSFVENHFNIGKNWYHLSIDYLWFMFSVTFFRLSRSNLHSYDREKKTPSFVEEEEGVGAGLISLLDKVSISSLPWVFP